MRRKDPAMLAKLQQAIDDGGDRRPPLHQWMSSNYDELIALFDDTRLNWDRITASFREMGFRNGGGGDLMPETVRQTWYRVRKHKETRARRATKPSPAPVEVLRLPPTPSPTPAPPLQTDDPMAGLMAEMNRRSGRI